MCMWIYCVIERGIPYCILYNDYSNFVLLRENPWSWSLCQFSFFFLPKLIQWCKSHFLYNLYLEYNTSYCIVLQHGQNMVSQTPPIHCSPNSNCTQVYHKYMQASYVPIQTPCLMILYLMQCHVICIINFIGTLFPHYPRTPLYMLIHMYHTSLWHMTTCSQLWWSFTQVNTMPLQDTPLKQGF